MYDGNPISWKSKKQELVATSTMEAECIIGYMQRNTGLQKLIQDISSPQKSPTVLLEKLIAEINCEKGNTEQLSISNSILPPIILYSDNQAAIKTVKTEGLKANFDIRLMSSRNLWKKGFVEFEYINTTVSLADISTKALPRDRHQHLTGRLRLHKILD
jgi:hypothetical protein